MIKKICILFLALAVLISVCPQHAFAASSIDLSRIKFSSGSEDLIFKFGNLKMDGKVCQEYPFTEEEINKIVKETLKEQGLTELDIRDANLKVERARKASEITQKDLQRVKDNFLKTMGVAPGTRDAATILKVVDEYMKSSSWDDVGTASANLLEDSMADWVKETASGFVNEA